MSYVYFIGGMGRNEKVLSINLGVSRNPETVLASWKAIMPFELKILGLQAGTAEQLETLEKEFRPDRVHGSWYKPSEALLEYIKGLSQISPEVATTRVSLDLNPEELTSVEHMVEVQNASTKAGLIRKALRFYGLLVEHKEKGYLIQAVRGGTLLQFPELDVPYPQTIREHKTVKRKRPIK